jgi:diguanylate cyclase (GGDEF)-like protein/PAS domain S-box-containing protein
MAPSRQGSGEAAAGGRYSWMILASALTAVMFVVLRMRGLLGDMPLGELVPILLAGFVLGQVAVRLWGTDPTPVQLRALLGVQMMTVTMVIYAIGWGPTLAIGYAFVAAGDLEEIGSRIWRPALAWTVVGIAAGQIAIAAGWVHSYVAVPYVHGLGVLSALGVGFVVHLLGTKTAAQEQAANELRASEANARQLFFDNPQPMWVYDSETLAFLQVNEAAIHHYGYSREEFLARRITDICPADETDRVMRELEQPRRGLQSNGVWRHQLKDGRPIDVETHSHKLTFADRPAELVTIQDVTQRVTLEAELRHQAFHDSLTNLPNRALFADRVDHAMRQRFDGRLAAVLLLDLDAFKTVNDSLGHTVGDELLVGVALRLQSALRAADTAARLGGDEFAILLENVEDRQAVHETAQRCIDALEAPFYIAGKEIFIHASAGVTFAGTHGDNADELLRNADAAMYRAKSQGKGCYRIYEAEMHSAAVARLELDSDLRRAIQDDEFVVHYQPIVSLAADRVVSLEALVRWQHPQRGLIHPNDFIPVAEENGLIVDIGRQVLAKACRDTHVWQKRHPEHRLTIAVNLSTRQLADPQLVSDVVEILQASGLPPADLTLEITETALMTDPEIAIARLHELKAAGVRLAIDDFGTGYSSLGSLQRLPVDTLKIDKSFVDGVARGTEAAGVVHALIRLAGTLQLDIVAEGVEHGEQVRRLEELGCDQIQGFCFSHPLTPGGIEDMLHHPETARAYRAAAIGDPAVGRPTLRYNVTG